MLEWFYNYMLNFNVTGGGISWNTSWAFIACLGWILTMIIWFLIPRVTFHRKKLPG